MARASAKRLSEVAARIRACRFCVETPHGAKLPHEPRPVFRVSAKARLARRRARRPAISSTRRACRSTILPAIVCATGWASIARLSTTSRASPSFRWVSAFLETTPLAAICRRAPNAGRAGMTSFSRRCRRSKRCWRSGVTHRDYHFARLGCGLPKGASVSDIVARWREFQDDTAARLSAAASLLAQYGMAQAQPMVRDGSFAGAARRGRAARQNMRQGARDECFHRRGPAPRRDRQ